MPSYMITIHSVVDAITNSSSTFFTVGAKAGKEGIRALLEESIAADYEARNTSGMGGEVEIRTFDEDQDSNSDYYRNPRLFLTRDVGLSSDEAEEMVTQGDIYFIDVDRSMEYTKDAIRKHFRVLEVD